MMISSWIGIMLLICCIWMVIQYFVTVSRLGSRITEQVKVNTDIASELTDTKSQLDLANEKIAMFEKLTDEKNVSYYKTEAADYGSQLFQCQSQKHQLMHAVEAYVKTVSPQDAELFKLTSVVLNIKGDK